MKKFTFFLITSITLLTFSKGDVALAQMHNDNMEMMSKTGCKGFHMVDGGFSLLDQLDLTKEQRDKILNIKLSYKEKNDKIETEIMKTKYELKEEYSKEKIDSDKIKSLNAKLSKLKAQLIENRENQKVEILALLTPEQLNKFQELKKNWMWKMKKNMMWK